MEIHVNARDGSASLVEPDDFKGFKVVLTGDAPSRAAAFEAAGAAKVEEHAWITVEGLRRLAGDTVTDEWERNLEGMVGYASGHGWYDEELGAIRAHVERR